MFCSMVIIQSTRRRCSCGWCSCYLRGVVCDDTPCSLYSSPPAVPFAFVEGTAEQQRTSDSLDNKSIHFCDLSVNLDVLRASSELVMTAHLFAEPVFTLERILGSFQFPSFCCVRFIFEPRPWPPSFRSRAYTAVHVISPPTPLCYV